MRQQGGVMRIAFQLILCSSEHQVGLPSEGPHSFSVRHLSTEPRHEFLIQKSGYFKSFQSRVSTASSCTTKLQFSALKSIFWLLRYFVIVAVVLLAMYIPVIATRASHPFDVPCDRTGSEVQVGRYPIIPTIKQ